MTAHGPFRCCLLPLLAFLLASWLVASNHCGIAVADSLARNAADSLCCKADQTPPDPQHGTECTQCCGELSAPVPVTAAAPMAHWSETAPAWAADRSAEFSVGASPAVSAADATRRAPPPGIVNVTLLTFTRCEPALAPPVSVS